MVRAGVAYTGRCLSCLFWLCFSMCFNGAGGPCCFQIPGWLSEPGAPLLSLLCFSFVLKVFQWRADGHIVIPAWRRVQIVSLSCVFLLCFSFVLKGFQWRAGGHIVIPGRRGGSNYKCVRPPNESPTMHLLSFAGRLSSRPCVRRGHAL